MPIEPTVTIAIPVYNVEPYVAASVQSALTQTYPNTRLMIIDDCGTDRSMDIVEDEIEIHGASHRVQVMRHDSNRGLGEARNTAIQRCDTDYLYFLDSDDIMMPSAIEKLMAAALSADADITLGSSQVTNDKGADLHEYGTFPRMAITMPHAGIYLTAYAAPRINTEAWGKLYKTSLFRYNSIRTLHPIMEDIMLWMQTAYYAGTVTTITDVVYTYRRRPGSICTSGWRTPEKKAMAYNVHSDLHKWCAHHPCLGLKPVRERMDKILEGKMR